MINWNAIPATYNEAWTYLEMLGKLVSVVNKHENDIEDLQTEVTNIWANFANYYTKAEADEHFISEDDLLNYYTKEEADARFALVTDLVPIQQQINELKTSAALGGSVELILVPSGDITIGSGYYGAEYGTIDVKLGKYEALSEQPNDWTTNYTDYYYIDGVTGKYTKIPEQALPPQFIADTYYNYIPKNYDAILLSITYTLHRPHSAYTKTLTAMLNKSGYAYDFIVYDSVAQVGQFVLLEEEPNDWTTNYTEYYIDNNGKYVHVEEPNDHSVPQFAANTYYNHVDDNTATIAGSAITVHSYTNGDVYCHVKLLESTDTITDVIVTAVAFTEAGSATPEQKAALYALADVDGDGEITSADAYIILEFAGLAGQGIHYYPNTDAGFAEFMQAKHPDIYAGHVGEWKMPDVDGSGDVTMIDAQMVLQFYEKLILEEGYEDNPENFYLWMNGYIH